MALSKKIYVYFYENDETTGKPILKKRFEEQMHLYAALYKKTHGRWPDKLIIVPLSGSSQEIEFNENKSEEILLKVTDQLKEINEALSEAKLSNDPSKTLCNKKPSCKCGDYRPKCYSFIESMKEKKDFKGTAHQDVFGSINADLKKDENGIWINVITEQQECLKIKFKENSIDQLPDLQDLKKGKIIGLFNLKFNKRYGYFESKQSSRGYLCKD